MSAQRPMVAEGMQTVINVRPASGQDRALALPVPGGLLIALADGAGGSGDGAAAAQSLMELAKGLAGAAARTDWFAALDTFDDELSRALHGGQTTGVVAFVDHNQISGASVGDSSAYLFTPSGAATDLTARQRRKPLLGSGEALLVVFKAERCGARVLLASDGLVKYASQDRIASLASHGPMTEAADALVDCVRLPSGAFQDDVAVVLVSP